MTSRLRFFTQSASSDPPKPRLMTTGRSLNCSWRSLQSRIDELPTNSTPPAGCGCDASSSANAANACSHGEPFGASAAGVDGAPAAWAAKVRALNSAQANVETDLNVIKIRATTWRARLVIEFLQKFALCRDYTGSALH